MEYCAQAGNNEIERKIGIALKRNVIKRLEGFMKQPRVVRLVTIRGKVGQYGVWLN